MQPTRLLRLVLFSTIGLFCLMTIIGLLLPDTVKVSRTKDIEVPIDSIKPYIFQLKSWTNWIYGADSVQVTMTGMSKDGNPAVMLMGGFEISIREKTDSTMVTVWKSKENPMQLSRITILPRNKNNAATVNWTFEQALKWYPWERLSSMMFEKIFGIPMELGLEKLKAVCEKRPYDLQ